MSNKFLNSRMLCERYGVVARTLDRWQETGIIPPPIRINNVKYWDAAQVDQYDEQRAAKAVAS
jgi:DNA-binding transcriptional MerR regulator